MKITAAPVPAELTVCFFCAVFLTLATVLRIQYLEEYDKKTRTLKTAALCLFIFYCAYLATLLFLDKNYSRDVGLLYSGTNFNDYISIRTNFIPFKEISGFIKELSDGNTLNAIINIFGNLAAFAPFGLFLPLLFKKFRSLGPFFVFIIGILIFVEGCQLLTMTGSCDIDDIIMNSAGAAAVFFISKKLLPFLSRKVQEKDENSPYSEFLSLNP